MNKSKYSNLIQSGIVFITTLTADLIIRLLISKFFEVKEVRNLIGEYVCVYYWPNFGAAFGLLKGQHIFFIFLSAIISIFLIYLILKLPKERNFKLLCIDIGLILSGNFGNMIDRAFNGYVIDYIYLPKTPLPVFNLADIYISIGCIIAAVLFIFKYKEQDFYFLSFKDKKYRKL